jgi:peptidoglycan hydrolase-like protein with peptidoglycan-binding domain
MGNDQDVRAAQEALKSKGFDPGEIDGRMGPRTQAAISEFQRSAGLRETGRFDQATRSQLGIH